MFFVRQGTMSAENVTLTGNTAHWGGGLYASTDAVLALADTLIANNTAVFAGGLECHACYSMTATR